MSYTAVPTNPILQTGNGANLLTWSIVAGATGYSVTRSTDGVTFVQVATPTLNYYQDTSVTVGVDYWYQVASVNTTTGGYVFTVTSANAQSGAEYTNNGQTFTVINSILPGTSLVTLSTGAPLSSGTLTKISGTGDATITFSAIVSTGGVSPYAVPYPASITPCLPGQMNLGYIRYLAQLRADKLNSEFLTTDEWNSNINMSAFELYDILVTKYGDDYFMALPYVFSTTGAANYGLPDGSATYQVNGSPAQALYKLIGVDCGVAVGNNAWVTLPRFNWIDRNKFVYPQLQANALGVFNLSYRQMGNNLEFIPRPSAGQYIQVWYVPLMTQLLKDTDMLPFSLSGWVEYVIIDVALKALLKEESYEAASALQILKGALLERIETTAANKDVGQPNTVSDTRSNTGFYDGGSFGGNGSGAGW